MHDLFYLLGLGVIGTGALVVIITLFPLRRGPSLSRKVARPEQGKLPDKEP